MSTIEKLHTELNKYKQNLQYLNAVDDNSNWWTPIVGSKHYDVPESQDAYRSFAYICIHRKAKNFAKGQSFIYRRQAKERKELQKHPFKNVLDKLNPYNQTFKQQMYWLSVNMDLYGGQLWIPSSVDLPIGTELGNKVLTDLLPLPSRYVQPVLNSSNTQLDYYSYTAGGKEIKIKPEDCICFCYPHQDNPFYWSAPVSKFNFTLSIDYLQGKHRKAELINGGKLAGIMKFEGRITKERKEEKERQFEQEYGGTEGIGKTLHIGKDITYIPTQQTALEMDFSQTRKDIRDEIMNILEVDKSVLGVTEDVNLANASAGLRNWIENTLQPNADIFFTSQLNAYLKNIYGDRFEYDYEYTFETDRDSQLKTIDLYLRHNLIKKEKVAELEGFTAEDVPEPNPIPDFTPKEEETEDETNNKE